MSTGAPARSAPPERGHVAERWFGRRGAGAVIAPTQLPVLLGLCLIPGLTAAWIFWRHYPGSLFAPNHQLVVRDYLNIWAAGHLAAAGRLDTIFDPIAYADWLWKLFGRRLDQHTWGYPPQVLLLAIPFAALPLVAGFVSWAIATGAFLWAALRAAGLRGNYASAVVFSPAALGNALTGQNGALTAGALAAGLLLGRRRPIAAGALLGLLTMKPQLALLVPVCLLAARDWRCIAWTACFGLAYCGAGLAAFGWKPWLTYVTVTAPFMQRYIDGPFGLALHYMMVPPFITMRAAGASLHWAYGMQMAASLAFAAMVWWVWSRRHIERRAAVALVLCLAPLTTPYALAYDLVCVAAACALIVQMAVERGELRTGLLWILAPAWLWPGSAFLIGQTLVPGLGAICVALAAVVAGRYCRRMPACGGD